MSSEIDGGVVVAAAVAVPAAAAAVTVSAVLGAGWLAWQSGKLLVEANRAADRQIAEKKQQLEEAARHRKMTALAAYRQLVDMCTQILAQMESQTITEGVEEIERLKRELKQLCEAAIPEDTAQIESLTSLGYLKLDRIVRQQERVASWQLTDTEAGQYRGLSVADLMRELKIALAAMDITATDGKDVRAADPAVLARAKLTQEFAAVNRQVLAALTTIAEWETACGLSTASNAWCHSCFNGTDVLIAALCRPTTSNAELKKGIQRLRQSLEQFETMAPSMQQEMARKRTLYKVYAEAAAALGEKVQSIHSFSSADAIEETLHYLQQRAERAQKCAEIYRKLGRSAYICFALDQELQAMGYRVHDREKVLEMAKKKPQHATLGESKLPFYQWTEEDMTQLYTLAAECSLQVIVHDDGTVSMHTIADADTAEVVEAQRSHCAQMKTLYERLRKNWFVLYDFEETEDPESVTTVAHWRNSEDFAWGDAARVAKTARKKKKKAEPKAKHTT